MDALLISYTTVDFRTKTEMELALRRWDANKEKWLKKFKAAGMVSNINTQIWNKEGVFRIGRIFMYKDEKSFVACQKIFREFENEISDINRKISSSRGIVLDENILIYFFNFIYVRKYLKFNKIYEFLGYYYYFKMGV